MVFGAAVFGIIVRSCAVNLAGDRFCEALDEGGYGWVSYGGPALSSIRPYFCGGSKTTRL